MITRLILTEELLNLQVITCVMMVLVSILWVTLIRLLFLLLSSMEVDQTIEVGKQVGF